MMRAEYDFSQSRKNPYIQNLPQQEITIRLEEETISYFQELAKDTGLSYQELMTLYLRDCARLHQELVKVA